MNLPASIDTSLAAFDQEMEEEEFFYIEDGLPVSPGQPVGVDIDRGNIVEFILFDTVFWSLSDD